MNCSCSAAIDKQTIDKEVKHKAQFTIEAVRLSTLCRSLKQHAKTFLPLVSTARVIALLSLGLNGSDLLPSEEKIAFAGCRKLGILQLYANESDLLPAESQSVRRVCDLPCVIWRTAISAALQPKFATAKHDCSDRAPQATFR